MRAGSAITVATALVFGGLAVLLARNLAPNTSPAGATQSVVIASRPIPFGATLTADNVRVVAWPPETRIEGAFASIADLTRDGRRLALASFQPNEPILAGKVTPPNGRGTLSTQIEDGMRAVTVRVDEVRGVAGFVLPGDRVDVILTRGEGGTGEAGAFADVLLQDAKVLAVDQVVGDRQDKPTIARAVTLELPIAEAQKVILAQGIGRLSLVLRQAGEAMQARTARVTAASLSGTAAVDQTGSVASALEKKLDELTRRISAFDARPPQASAAEIEARIRAEMAARTPVPVAQPQRPTVSVTRNATKREEYSVSAER